MVRPCCAHYQPPVELNDLVIEDPSKSLVQLGGLEPPTSCSTDRRSNQLSYNCILARGPSKGGSRMGRKLGATPCFGKAAEHPIIVVSGRLYVHPAGPRPGSAPRSGSKKPGLSA